MKKKRNLVAIVLPIAAALLGSPLWAGSGQFVTPSAGHAPAFTNHRLVQKMQVFTANGTWTRPANVDVVHVTLVGGGGAGRSTTSVDTAGGSGGDGGQTVFKRPYPVTGNVSVVVGQRGNTAAVSIAENHGGDSSFGSLVARGGNGWRTSNSDPRKYLRMPVESDCRVGSLGSSGAGRGGRGKPGGDCGPYLGGRGSAYRGCAGGGGGASSMADGGDGGVQGINGGNGNAGTGYGAGGGGAGCRGGTGGNGASGVVIVEWWEWIEIRVPIFSNRAPNAYP